MTSQNQKTVPPVKESFNSKPAESAGESVSPEEFNSQNNFQWGGSRMNLRRVGSFTNNVFDTKTILKGPVTSSKTKLNSRVYKDVHSKGLVSRIIKYHDNTSRLNRSMSLNTLYNKPGQFPVVHLTKAVIPYKSIHNQTFSTANIAVPDNSFYNSFTNVSRYGSVMSMQKSDEEISRENRPILHPPPTDVEIAPTPSVLEVLKEISRKRINSDELVNTNGTKKCCNREFVKTQDCLWSSTNRAEETQNINRFVNCKRQREQLRSFNNSQQCITKTSPEQEQAVKKRMFGYNNDITSSLSSSLLSTNKRKFSHLKSGDISTNDISLEVNGENVNKQKYAGLSLEQNNLAVKTDSLSNNLSSQSQSFAGNKSVTTFSGSQHTPRTVSEPAIGTKDNQKPRLTLFNKAYDEGKNGSTCAVDKTKLKKREDSEASGINFVKPKKCSSVSIYNNDIVKRTQKSKLALMLSVLKGELDTNDSNDEGDIEPKPDTEMKTADMTQTEQSRSLSVPGTSISITTKSSEIESVPAVSNEVVTEKVKTAENSFQHEASVVSTNVPSLVPREKMKSTELTLSVPNTKTSPLTLEITKPITLTTTAISTFSSSANPATFSFIPPTSISTSNTSSDNVAALVPGAFNQANNLSASNKTTALILDNAKSYPLPAFPENMGSKDNSQSSSSNIRPTSVEMNKALKTTPFFSKLSENFNGQNEPSFNKAHVQSFNSSIPPLPTENTFVFGLKSNNMSNTDDKVSTPTTTKSTFSFNNPEDNSKCNLTNFNTSTAKIISSSETNKETSSKLGKPIEKSESIMTPCTTSSTFGHSLSKEFKPNSQPSVGAFQNQFSFQPKTGNSPNVNSSPSTFGGFQFDNKVQNESMTQTSINKVFTTNTNYNSDNKLPTPSNGNQNNFATNLFNDSAPQFEQSPFASASNKINFKTNLFSIASTEQNLPASSNVNGFTFGNKNTEVTSSPSLFTFGKGNIEPQKIVPTSLNKSFNFGAPAPASNLFASASVPNANGIAFQFNATPASKSNEMHFPTLLDQGPGPGARPIRRATRRLQKP